MMAKEQLDIPDPPPVDPPVVKPSYEVLEARAAKYEAENIELRAERDARDKAKAEAAAELADDNVANPARCYLLRAEAAFQAGVDPGTAWGLFSKGVVYGYKIDGTSRIMLCRNDLIDWRLKTGRHGKPAKIF
jgi:hypothetical protein